MPCVMFLSGPSVVQIQLTLVISTSLISNDRLSRTENLVPDFHHDNLTPDKKILWKKEVAPKE